MKKLVILSPFLLFACNQPSQNQSRISQLDYYLKEAKSYPLLSKGHADNMRKADSITSLMRIEDSLSTIRNKRIIDSAEKAKH